MTGSRNFHPVGSSDTSNMGNMMRDLIWSSLDKYKVSSKTAVIQSKNDSRLLVPHNSIRSWHFLVSISQIGVRLTGVLTLQNAIRDRHFLPIRTMWHSLGASLCDWYRPCDLERISALKSHVRYQWKVHSPGFAGPILSELNKSWILIKHCGLATSIYQKRLDEHIPHIVWLIYWRIFEQLPPNSYPFGEKLPPGRLDSQAAIEPIETGFESTFPMVMHRKSSISNCSLWGYRDSFGSCNSYTRQVWCNRQLPRLAPSKQASKDYINRRFDAIQIYLSKIWRWASGSSVINKQFTRLRDLFPPTRPFLNLGFGTQECRILECPKYSKSPNTRSFALPFAYNMAFSRIVDVSKPFGYEPLNFGFVVKATATAMLVVGFLKFIKSLTERSPYDHIPGPKPSTILGMSSSMQKMVDGSLIHGAY